mmetsp:Transcript_236/g.331  ORF Transcript_236/g.331 Transcript_236/m.331 type:complete len:182 (+) Transcript_236:1-546(+)
MGETTTPVIVHAGAGMGAGVMRSMFWMAWEATVHDSNWIRQHPKFCVRTTIHHAFGYGALFGSYQGIRQCLILSDPLLPILDNVLPNQKQDEKARAVTYAQWCPFLYSFVSGGMAGQIHHILSHYTGHWKQFRSNIPPPPRLYPTMTSFGTMALCFAAFEHGPEAVDEMLSYVNTLMKGSY